METSATTRADENGTMTSKRNTHAGVPGSRILEENHPTSLPFDRFRTFARSSDDHTRRSPRSTVILPDTQCQAPQGSQMKLDTGQLGLNLGRNVLVPHTVSKKVFLGTCRHSVSRALVRTTRDRQHATVLPKLKLRIFKLSVFSLDLECKTKVTILNTLRIIPPG